jgi:hypothetical protein
MLPCQQTARAQEDPNDVHAPDAAPVRLFNDRREPEDVKREFARTFKQFGVRVHVIYDPDSYFPTKWKRAPFLARGSQIQPDESRRLAHLIDSFLSMYPSQVVANNLHDIYLLKTLSFYGLDYGGTNSQDAIYIASQGRDAKAPDDGLAAMMHAEFSSILYRNYGFPVEEWNKVNDKNWRYIGVGKDLLGRRGLYDQTEALLRRGFVSFYSQASLEEDVNMCIFFVSKAPRSLALATARHKRVRQKLEILARFYERIKMQLYCAGDFLFLNRLKSTIDPATQALFDLPGILVH